MKMEQVGLPWTIDGKTQKLFMKKKTPNEIDKRRNRNWTRNSKSFWKKHLLSPQLFFCTDDEKKNWIDQTQKFSTAKIKILKKKKIGQDGWWGKMTWTWAAATVAPSTSSHLFLGLFNWPSRTARKTLSLSLFLSLSLSHTHTHTLSLTHTYWSESEEKNLLDRHRKGFTVKKGTITVNKCRIFLSCTIILLGHYLCVFKCNKLVRLCKDTFPRACYFVRKARIYIL